MDDSIRLPTGHRIGLDGLLGLIPGLGDVLGAGVSSYFVIAAVRLGAPASVVLRMCGNVLLELTLGAIPIAGDLFDLFFKANVRNYRLLERYQSNPKRATSTSIAVLFVSGLIIACLMAAAIFVAGSIISALWRLVAGA